MNNIIDGMTILEQTMIKEASDIAIISLKTGFIWAMVSVIPIFIGLIKYNKKIKNIGILSYIVGIIIMIYIAIPFPWNSVDTGRYTYKCTFEDNVSANYIEEHFNIISVKDGIWTITDK